jgi:septum formation protein
MRTPYTLYLASQSLARAQLLAQAQIPFTVVQHAAHEKLPDGSLSLDQVVVALAEEKMNTVLLPHTSEGQVAYVLTADTLAQDYTGKIFRKPLDEKRAILDIKRLRGGSIISTGFCLSRTRYINGSWLAQERVSQAVQASCIFNVPDHWLSAYLEQTNALQVTGGITIEGFGGQFLESVQGSYSTILGLPLFEVRIALEKLGFFGP